jgi:hypothetical protein
MDYWMTIEWLLNDYSNDSMNEFNYVELHFKSHMNHNKEDQYIILETFNTTQLAKMKNLWTLILKRIFLISEMNSYFWSLK